MKKNVVMTLILATMISSLSLAGCGTAKSTPAAEETAKQVEEAVESSSELNEATTEAEKAVTEAASTVADEIGEDFDLEAEFNALKENLVYMGGLYISEPDNDLMMVIFKNEGTPIVVVEKLGNIYYGELKTEDGTLEDGREYVKFVLEDKEFGYHFKLDEKDSDPFLVDEDGKVYSAKDVDEGAALDVVMDTLQ